MNFLSIVPLTLFLFGAARRSIHIGDSYHDAQQQINTVATALEESAKASEQHGRHYRSAADVSESDVGAKYETGWLPEAGLRFFGRRAAPRGDAPVLSGRPGRRGSFGGSDVGSSVSSGSRRSLIGAAAAAAVASVPPAMVSAQNIDVSTFWGVPQKDSNFTEGVEPAVKTSNKVRKELVIKPGPKSLLAPIYRTRTALRQLKREVERETVVPPGAVKTVDIFAKGEAKNLLRKAGQFYVDEIQYDDLGGTELDAIEADRKTRLDALELVIGSLEKAADISKSSGREEFIGLITKAIEGVDRFLAMVPPEDVEAYDDLVKALRRADMDLDGELTGRELELLELTKDQKALYSEVGPLLLIYT